MTSIGFFCPGFLEDAGFKGWSRRENQLTPHMSSHTSDGTPKELFRRSGYFICTKCKWFAVPLKFIKSGLCKSCCKLIVRIDQCKILTDKNFNVPPTIITPKKLDSLPSTPPVIITSSDGQAPYFQSPPHGGSSPLSPPNSIDPPLPPQPDPLLFGKFTLSEVWETKVDTVDFIPRQILNKFTHAWLSISRARINGWDLEEVHAIEVFFIKSILQVQFGSEKQRRLQEM